MHFQQFYLESLGHASYLLASETTGEALVVDPRRDIDEYLRAAAHAGARVRYVLDTHQHNDYLSGIRELVDRTGATALGSAEAALGYDHEPVKDGHELELGEVGIRLLHTPGHTPEHMSALVHDGEHDRDEPALLLSGGALLVGDLARPDLLGGETEARRHAETLCHTLQTKILTLPDHVIVYPTHVAGSLCGGSIGSRLATTVGYERRVNEVLANVDATDEVVGACLDVSGLPAVPPYWRRMRAQNEHGPALLGVVDPPPALSAADVADCAEDGAIVLDARAPEAFAGGHIPGALNVGLGASFATWAGSVLPEGARVALVLDGASALMEATWQLLRIGYPRPLGWLAAGMQGWRTSARPVATLPTVSVHDLEGRTDAFHVLDVRQPSEWAAGTAPGAQLLTGAELAERVGEVPADRDVLTVCGSGYRSGVAASLLRRHGHERVTNLLGGMTAWQRAGLPLKGG
jgi:hydroxyacylglutathione hydrolase